MRDEARGDSASGGAALAPPRSKLSSTCPTVGRRGSSLAGDGVDGAATLARGAAGARLSFGIVPFAFSSTTVRSFTALMSDGNWLEKVTDEDYLARVR